MARRNKRQLSAFNLSFLDVMSCGFGAVILLFLIMKHNVDAQAIIPADTRLQESEVSLLDEEILEGQKNLAQIRNTISEIDDRLAIAQGLARRIMEEKEETAALIEEIVQQADTVDLEQIKAQIKKLELRNQQIEQEARKSGEQARRVAGEGTRQYVTGLKLAGTYQLILLDVSASMLDDTIVNVLRFRNMRDERKRHAEKWVRTRALVEWLIANFPVDSKFQLYVFNDQAGAVVPETAGKWLDLRNKVDQDKVVEALRAIVPAQGTNLEKAFIAAGQLRPRPDSIYLVTDGLPTLGSREARTEMIAGKDRVKLFREALKSAPTDVPINVILAPLEGDPAAAYAYWQLAQRTDGSFMSPSRDWP
jgi:hypothetical protein